MKSLNKLIFILILLIAQFAAAAYKFEGISEEQVSKLKSDLRTLFVVKPSYENTDKIVRYLVSLGNFQNVAAYEVNGNILIVGYGLKKIGNITIVGNKHIDSDELLQLITLEPNADFERKRVIEAGNKVKEYYGRMGFFNTKIEVSFEPGQEDLLNILFKITENKPCLISEIHIDSENESLKKKLSAKVKGQIDERFTEERITTINNKAEDIFRSDKYLRAKLQEVKVEYNSDKTTAKLFYKVTQPYRYELVLTGNSSVTRYHILKSIDLAGITSSDLEPSIEVENRTRDIYFKKGFPHVKISVSQKPKKDTYSRVIFLEVEEGPRVKIDSLEVAGRISRPAKFYANFIFENSTDLIGDGYYNKVDLELGYENLVTHLRNQGFLRAKIHSSRVEYNKSKDKAKVQLVMDEGPLTQIRRIRFQGAKDFSDIQLMKVIALKTNSPLRLKALEEAVVKLKLYYSKNGYLEMKIKNENDNLISYNEKGTEAYINFMLYEGPQVRIKSVEVEGNSFTKTKVVLSEADFEIGEVLSREKLQLATRRLNRLGIFSRVNISTLEQGTEISDRTVVISVTERKPGLFRSGVGFTSEDNLTLRGFVGATYNNLWGTARGLSGRVEVESNITDSEQVQSKVSLGYLEPFIMGTRTRGRINWTYHLDELSVKDKVSTMRESQRTDFLLIRELTENLKLSWTLWSIDAQRNFITQADPNFTRTSTDIATIGPLFEIDFRDNQFLPKSGSYSRWDTQYSAPKFGSSDTIKFFRTEASFSYYIPVFDTGVTWANNISGGYLKNLSPVESGGGVPSSRAFFLHGQSKVRGYGGSNTIEHIPNGDQFELGESIVTGKSNYYLFKTEFRMPVPSLDPLAIALFYDIGAVKFTDSDKQCVSKDESDNCLSTDPIRQSAGIGLHFNTPLGPIVLEVARKLDVRYGEREDRFHFSIGSF